MEDGDNDDESMIHIGDEFSDPPKDWKPPNTIPKGFVPEGWTYHVIFVYKESRCTDEFVHIFSGDSDELSLASESISRQQACNVEKEEQQKDRNYGMTGKRGATFLEMTILVQAVFRRSNDKAMQLTYVFVAV